jgi:hypothetical protein
MVRNGALIVPALVSEPLVDTKKVAESNCRGSSASTATAGRRAVIQGIAIKDNGTAALSRWAQKARTKPVADSTALRMAAEYRDRFSAAAARRPAPMGRAAKPRQTLDNGPWGIISPGKRGRA